ncbi:MAG: argininosuccinate synthase [Candidatus Gracilibacteria bacterium]
MKKVILAFSGGLDTSYCIPFLKEKGYEVITVTVNTGGFSPEDLTGIKNRSEELGAIKHYEVDAQQSLYDQFASYIIKANYLRGGVYPACVGPERNVIVAEVVKIARKENIKCIAHGSTGAGNDQVRFEVALRALVENCEILAPIRDSGIQREDEALFLTKKGFPVDAAKKDYSINVGLMGTTIGGKETFDTEKVLPDEAFPNVKSIDDSLDTPGECEMTFEKGLPIQLDGKTLNGVEIITHLNEMGALHGFGRDYQIGTTIIGNKARLGFESPAMKILIKAHMELEKMVLTSKQIFWKNMLGNLYGDLLHEALYYEPLVKNLEAFLDSVNEYVRGTVKVKIYKGVLSITSMKSPYSLLNLKFGKYGEKMGAWNGEDAKGFCRIYGMESVNAFLTQSNHE